MTTRSSALRRRRKPSLVTRLRIRWVFIACAVGAVGYLGYLFVTLPAFRARTVDVRIDGLNVSQREVLAAAHLDRDANIWLLDTAAMVRRIEAIPYVGSAGVRRVPPAHLAIVVSEREPVACVTNGAHVVTIDRARRILQAGCARRDVVPLLETSAALGPPGSSAGAPAVAELLADAQTLADANIAVRSLREDRFGELVATDGSGVELEFGSDADLADKARLIHPIVAATSPKRTIRAIDVRAPTTPTVLFR